MFIMIGNGTIMPWDPTKTHHCELVRSRQESNDLESYNRPSWVN